MDLTRDLKGEDLVHPDSGIWIACDGAPPPDSPAVGPRVGIRHAIELPWRWHVAGHGHVSRTRAGVPPVRKKRSPRDISGR